ncbi:cysteine desulfurase family protein [Pseudoalteromonas sp. SSM20]|uniref:cysteine desulfurase family protein n=1 Tax=Pseudoalteromonas sp. SSM20 TaxID=3139394 RepID=UPI003BAB9E5F
MIYFDTAASYPVLPEVQIALKEAFENTFANSASSHFLGEQSLEQVNKVREQLAEKIGAFASEIVFTSGATESNNIAFKSVLFGGDVAENKKHIVISAIEHKCIFSICDFLEKQGYEFTIVKPNLQGIIEPESIRDALREDTALVSVMHVNNELGTINPISEIGKVCFEKNVLFHTDAAQSFGKIEIDVDDMNVDIMSFSAHKIGGPKGIGAIYIRDLRKHNLQPVIHGAGQEDGLRGGTVATPLIMGFGTAIEYFEKYYQAFKEKNIKQYLLQQLEEQNIHYQINGHLDSLPHCLSLSLLEVNTGLLIRENESLMCLAQGSACSSKEIEASHVLTALGLTREEAENTFRISFSYDISIKDIDLLIDAIKKAA